MYNLWHYKQLKHNKEAYKKFGIHKPLFASVSSKDFPDKKSQAWLDVENSSIVVQNKPSFAGLNPLIQQQLIDWSQNGYLILPGMLDENKVTAINNEVQQLMQTGRLGFTNGNKLMFAHKQSELINGVTQLPELVAVLEFILQKKVVPFQTINFLTGSQQKAHSDSIHMTTYPLGYLIAVWIALEDITAENGPLFYYPGSHQLPFLLNSDYDQSSTLLALGKKQYTDYEDALEDILKENQLAPQAFLAKKGDMLIWHANLVHGGTPILDKNSTRKSMVIHYYAADVIKYHEITERPSLLQ